MLNSPTSEQQTSMSWDVVTKSFFEVCGYKLLVSASHELPAHAITPRSYIPHLRIIDANNSYDGLPAQWAHPPAPFCYTLSARVASCSVPTVEEDGSPRPRQADDASFTRGCRVICIVSDRLCSAC